MLNEKEKTELQSLHEAIDILECFNGQDIFRELELRRKADEKQLKEIYNKEF